MPGGPSAKTNASPKLEPSHFGGYVYTEYALPNDMHGLTYVAKRDIFFHFADTGACFQLMGKGCLMQGTSRSTSIVFNQYSRNNFRLSTAGCQSGMSTLPPGLNIPGRIRPFMLISLFCDPVCLCTPMNPMNL